MNANQNNWLRVIFFLLTPEDSRFTGKRPQHGFCAESETAGRFKAIFWMLVALPVSWLLTLL
ncbi:hypothetical protein [Desulfonema ishimotonii]|uniref:hypothetical protein n=1 Tax=Desulfonema ishimotonii TaxID=45657 RepID=UPI000F5843E0|nr:hypothetical protein [Desulfonema ishimotonii]